MPLHAAGMESISSLSGSERDSESDSVKHTRRGRCHGTRAAQRISCEGHARVSRCVPVTARRRQPRVTEVGQSSGKQRGHSQASERHSTAQQSTEERKVANAHAMNAVMSCLDANAAGQACRGQGYGKCLARGRRRHKATKASRSGVCSPDGRYARPTGAVL